MAKPEKGPAVEVEVKKLLALQYALLNEDIEEAYFQLYSMLDSNFEPGKESFKEWEELLSKEELQEIYYYANIT